MYVFLAAKSGHDKAIMAQVLNYHDAVVYDTDVGLFGDGEWLNDNCINWFFRYLCFSTYPCRTCRRMGHPPCLSIPQQG